MRMPTHSYPFLEFLPAPLRKHAMPEQIHPIDGWGNAKEDDREECGALEQASPFLKRNLLSQGE